MEIDDDDLSSLEVGFAKIVAPWKLIVGVSVVLWSTVVIGEWRFDNLYDCMSFDSEDDFLYRLSKRQRPTTTVLLKALLTRTIRFR